MSLARDDAQTNIDFLFGLAIFLMGFLYVFTFVPGLFVPYQASAVDLSSVAYKTGAVLVEDPGWYIYTVGSNQMGNPSWESANASELARIGLAEDKMLPNVLSIDKITALNNISSYDTVREKIGLNGSITYNFSLSLVMSDTLAHKQIQLINIDQALKGESVESMDREVLVDMGKELYIDGYNPNLPTAAMITSVVDMQAYDTHNVTFRIYNTSGDLQKLLWQDDPLNLPVPMVYKSQFIVRKNGVDVPVLPVAFNSNDVIEIFVYNKPVRDLGVQYLWVVSGSNIFPGGQLNYYSDPVYKLRSSCYPATFKIGVWSDEV